MSDSNECREVRAGGAQVFTVLDVGASEKEMFESQHLPPDTRSFTVETELSELGLQLAQSQHLPPDTRSFTVETELSELGLQLAQVVSDAAGQGVAITGNQTFNNWNWPNAMIFAATVITTIGYGNVAPKTPAGRLFCVFYGLSGVPLCLTWISALGKFFGGRAKSLGRFLTKRGVSLRKAQITCTAIFILWGVLVHLVIPPFVFMVTEEWNYIEGLYYSFITISTIGFGDFVAVSGQQTFAGAPGRRSVFWALRPP
ncbi:PREDICTED: potassium channel subfamily K member 5-like, partial [Galeopterus variegatus]|uniref:Potassium channel subfamily K member 5-like n=1 Tax=Galeopterus variegatus TaxID=482537 RepID=A0ABM0Q0E0_GALVR